MRGLQLIPHNTKIDFVGLRYVGYALSTLVIIGSLISLAVKGINYGIDFKGGFLLEIRTSEPINLGNMRNKLDHLGLGAVKLQEFGSKNDLMIRVEEQKGGEKAQLAALAKIKDTIGPNVEYRRVETVGSKVSGDLIENGILALTFSLVGMMLYIWFRFEWQYGICGIIALVHDAVAVLGFYSISGIDFNETALVAILMAIAYSINDSVVVYDRLRENLRKYKSTPMSDVMNLSINETLSRTLLTSSTHLIALLALYIFGGPVIESFSLPMFVGVIFGTFSSIFISVNLLLYFDLRKPKPDELS